MGHSERVTGLAVALARGMGLPEDSILNLQRGGLVHDLGKIGLSAEILDGPNPLTPEQWEIVRAHPEAGVRILEPIPAMESVIPIVFHHHESWDGSGYPMGLSGEAIPLEARVLAVADRFDAMTSERPYRKGVALPDAKRWIRDQAGKTLDPNVTEAFLCLLEEGRLPVPTHLSDGVPR
jgi:putative two-component system response regulator